MMTLSLNLPQDIDEMLARKATRQGVAKETLAIDLIVRSLEDADGNLQAEADFTNGTDFWSPIDIEALAKVQGVKPIDNFDEWWRGLPRVEGADELGEVLERLRRERREQDRSRP